MISLSHLEAIRDRYAKGFGDIEQAAEDVGSLLADRDEIDRQLKGIEQELGVTLERARLMLAMKLQADGYATTLGEAVRIASQPDRLRDIYPDDVLPA